MEGKNQKIKIFYFIYQLGYGGAQRLILDLVSELDRSRYDPIVGMWGGREDLVSDFNKLNVEVVNMDGRGKVDLRALWRLYKFLSDTHIDILNTHLPHAHVVGRIAGKLAGVPWIVATHQNVYSANHPITRVADVATMWMDDIVTNITKGVEESFFEDSELFSRETLQNGRSHFTIYSGVNISKIKDVISSVNVKSKRTDLGLSMEDYIFVCAARLHPNKAHWVIIDAVSKISERYPDIKVLLLGDGPMEVELKKKVREMGVGDSIHFLGYREDVYEIFAASDSFVLSSINEGFGIAIAEAMAASLPVVATEIPAVVEVVNDGTTGLLVPPSDPDALARAMMKYMDDIDLARNHGKQGRKRVEEKFSISAVADKYEVLYESLLYPDAGK